MNPVSWAITAVYTFLVGWGFWVGLRQVWQGLHAPDTLLNPLFRNKHAQRIFAFHLAIVSTDLFICGPISLAHKARFWYWGGRIALLTCSMPLFAFLNRNPQSFGKLIGYWVRFRNIFEISLHALVAAAALNWFHYYGLLYWLVAYRYLDVGPRRAIQKLYNTPEKKAARPWAPILNWVTITTIYVLAALAVYHKMIVFAKVPDESLPEHISGFWEMAAVLAINVGVLIATWLLTRNYALSLVEEKQQSAISAVAG
ncbi:MAG: hypothetical protein JSU00_06610 [Acidobacteria bacterium]|nr:hypothetical protein [Acidobacteriota bacterium]